MMTEQRTRFSSIAAPASAPVPVWVLYPLFFVAVYLSHFTLLRLPWFWDEAGYYIPAALDFYRTGSLIPHSTLTNAHPPLPSVMLGLWWRLSGYHIAATRMFLAMLAAAALLGVFRLVRVVAGDAAAFAVTLLTGMYPVWFAQSTMAHADLFAAAFTLWALGSCVKRYAGQGRGTDRIAAAVLFSFAALAKETAIVTPVVLALWELSVLLTRTPVDAPISPEPNPEPNPEPEQKASAAWVAALLFPVLPLALWYLYHRQATGFMFGNPEFLRYNATANLTPLRILLSLWHRVIHLTLHMNLWVPVLATLGLLFTATRKGSRGLARPVLQTVWVVLIGNALAFSVLGGALLTRYLLPLYPLVLLLCVTVWQRRLRLWPLVAVLAGAGFLAALWINPPYSFAPEDNLTYRDFVLLHQQAIRVIDSRFPAATVLTAWPATTELEHPDLGYTIRPIAVAPIENFSLAEIQKAAADPGAFDTALIFSTKWVPPAGGFSLSHKSEASDTRFYDFHRDLTPQQVAAMLHGEIVWQGERHGEWAAVLHFPRIVEALNQQPDGSNGRLRSSRPGSPGYPYTCSRR